MQAIPTEEQEQAVLAQLLDNLKLTWFHVPNEGKRKPQYAVKMARLGLKSGVPDVLIFNTPPNLKGHKGAAIELKRIKGGRISKTQIEWRDNLVRQGWAHAYCKGIDEAVETLKLWGYMK